MNYENYIKQCFVFAIKLMLSISWIITFSVASLYGQTPTYFKVGTGTTGNTIPMGQASQKTQLLYPPGSFNTVPISGNITKIYFRNSASAITSIYTDFKVLFIQNNDAAFPGTSFYTGLTIALNEPSLTLTGNVTAPGWFEINLTTPFLYDNSKSLVVEIQYSARSGATFSTTTTTSTGFNRRCSGTSLVATTGTTNTTWNDFGMDVISAGGCTTPPTPGASTAIPSSGLCLGNNISLSLSGNSTGTGQTYQWQSSPTIGFASPTNVGSSQISPALIVSATSTLYYRCEVTCSGNSQYSTPVLVTITPPFPGGTYTINSALATGGSNFQTFADAVNALTCGIAGPIVFNVDSASGPYTEQITIPVINGVSSINTITFNGNGRTLQFTPVTANRHVLKFNGADYVIVNNLLIKGLATDFDWGIHLTNTSDNITINGCEIDITANTSTTQSNSAGIVSSGSATSVTTTGNNASNLTVSGCTIKGGYQGIILNGLATGLNAVNNIIYNNNIFDAYANGIELTHNDGALITGNNISRSNRTIMLSASAGIEIGTGNRNVTINANRIHDTHTSVITQSGTSYGIYFNACDAPVGSENHVTNNLIYNFNSTTGTQYGLYNVGSDGVFYYHNTVVLSNALSTSGTTYAFHQTTSALNIQVRDNLLFVTRGGTGTKNCLRFATTASTIISNNNDLYINSPAGTNGVGFYSVNFPTLTGPGGWQTANGAIYDQASVSVDPIFLSPGTGNYKPTTIVLDNLGSPVGVTTDITNASRSLTTPDMGAYEFTISAGIDVGAFSLVTPLTTGCYSNIQQVVVKLKNYGSLIDFSTDPVTITCDITGAGSATLSGTVSSGTLAINGTLDVALSGTFDMSANGIYNFSAYSICGSDANPANDTMPAATRTRSAVASGTASASLTSLCVSGSPVLTLAGSSGGSIQWQESTISNSGPWNNVGSGAATYAPGTVSQTTYYQAVVSCLSDIDTSNVVTITVNSPSLVSTSGGSHCGPGSVTLNATGSVGTVINWYAAPTGGIPLGTGASFNTPSILTTTNFYAAASTGGFSANAGLPASLPSATSGAGTTNFGLVFDALSAFTINSVTVYPVSASSLPGTVTIDVINSAGVVLHTVTAVVVGSPAAIPVAHVINLNFNVLPGTNLKMRPGFTGITGLLFEPAAGAPGTPPNYGYPFVVPGVLSINTSTLTAAPLNTARNDLYYYFYNWSISTGCESARTSVTATITAPPAIIVSSADPGVCGGNSTTINVSSPNDPNYSYSWTSSPAGFTATGAGPHTVTPSVTTKYYVTATDTSGGANNGCSNIDSVTVVAVGALTAGTASASQYTYCVSGTPTLMLIGSAGTIQWQESTTSASGPWNNVGTGTTTYVPLSAITQTTYYQAVVSCQTNFDTSNVVTVTVDNPQVLSTTPNTRCGLGTVVLQATGSPGTTLNWFANASGGTSLGAGTSFTTPVITSSTTFHVEASTGGGGSDSVAVPLGTGTTTGVYHHMFLVSSPTGMKLTGFGIKCNNAAGTLTAWDIYYRPDNYQLVAGSNLSSAGWILLASVTNVPSLGATDYTYLALGLNLNIPPGSTYSFYVAPVGSSTHQYGTSTAGTTVTTNANASIIAGHRGSALFNCNTASGIAIVKLTYTLGCTGARTPVLATVTPAPPLSITAGSLTICQGISTTLSVGTGLVDYTDFAWSPATGLSATTGSSIIATPLVTTKYYLGALNSTSNCQAVDSVTIVVNSVTINLLVDNPLVCNSGTAQLNASTGTGSFSYDWSPSTGLSSSSVANPVVTPPAASTTYTVLVTDLSTGCTKTSTTTIYKSEPQLISASVNDRCGPGPVTFQASGTPGLVKWWSAPTGGTLVATGSPYVANISANTTYYAAIKDVIPQTPVSTGFGGATTATDPNAAGNMFNVVALHDLTITGFDIHLNNNGALAPSNISVYYKAGTYIGFNNNAAAWTLAGSVNGLTSSGNGVPTTLPLTLAINIPAGQTYGIYIVVTNLGVANSLRYLSSANSPAEGAVAASDYNLQVTSGTVSFGPFTGVPGAPINRLWNGRVKYNIGCESARTAVTASVSTPPAISITGNSLVCAGSSTILSVTSPNDPNNKYTWNPGGLTGSSVSVSPSATTTYTVTANDTTTGGSNSGCSNIGTFAVTVNSLPDITSISATPNSVCGEGNPVTLTALTGTSVSSVVSIGTPTTSIQIGMPFRVGNGSAIKNQYLYKASELTAAGLSSGNITSIAYNFTTAAGGGTCPNLTISLGTTSATALTTTFQPAPGTVVFGPQNVSPPTVTGVFTLTFATPFYWDGVSNIIVQFCHDLPNPTGTSGQVESNVTPFVSTTWTTACATLTGTAISNRPVARFGGQVGGGSGPGTYGWQWNPGIIPPGNVATVVPIVSTTYTVTATNPLTGCTKTSSVSINVTPTPKPQLGEGDSVLCSNDAGFYMHVSDTNAYVGGYPVGTTFNFYGAGAILYQSGTDSNFFNANNSDAFYVVVTLPGSLGNCSGVSDTSVIDFGNAQAPQYLLTTDSVRCYGESNGKAMAEIIFGGTPRFRWQWYNSSHLLVRDVTSTSLSDTLSGMPEGMYTIVITDHQDSLTSPYCSITDSIFIGQPAAPLAVTENTGNHVNVLCNGAHTGVIDIDVTGGTEPYSYNWSHSASSEDATGTGAGTYTCTVTDARGCTVVITSTITEPSAIVISSTVNQIQCNGGTGSVTISVTGGVGSYSYEWSNSSFVSSNTGLTAGTYTVTVTDGNGCTKSATFVIDTEPTVVTANCNSTPVSCFGGNNGTVGVTADGGTPGYTYSWSNGSTSASQTSLPKGIYTVTVTDAHGCTASCSTSIIQPTQLVVTTTSVNPTSALPNSGSINVNAAGGTPSYSYLWNNGSTTQNRTSLTSGTYTVTVTDANGCTQSKVVTLIYTCALSVTNQVVQKPSCGKANGIVTVIPSGGTSYTYAWQTSPVQTTATGTGLSYYYNDYCIITDVSGCSLIDTVIKPTSNGLTLTLTSPAYAGGKNIRCHGETNGSISLTVSGSTGPYTYLWNTGATTQNLTGVGAGTYIVTVSNGGCTNSNLITLTQPSALLVTATGVNVTCSGGSNGSATATPSGGTAPYSYSWNTSPVKTSATATGLTAGTYIVTVSDANGCTKTAVVTLTQPATGVSVSGVVTNVNCNGGTTGSIDITPSGGTPAYTYLWTGGVTTQDRINALAAGTYTVTVADSKGCTAQYSNTITQPTAITATATTTNVNCNGGSNGTGSVTASGGTPPYTYSWNTVPPKSGANVNGIKKGTYTVIITDSKGCVKAITVTITEPAAIVIGISKTNVTTAGGSNGTATANVSGGVAPYSYSWNTVPVKTTQAATGLIAGTYTVTVTDANGCTKTASVVITQPTARMADGTQSDGASNSVVFPNPSTGNFTVTFDETIRTDVNLQVMNMTGERVFMKDFDVSEQSNSFSIDLGALPKGIYFIRYRTNEKDWIDKLVIR